MSDYEVINNWYSKALRFNKEAHNILSLHEASSSRVVLLEDLLDKLSGLPVDIEDYFLESVQCLKNKFFRAAIIISWSGFFYVFSEKFYTLYETSIKQKRSNWNYNNFEDFLEFPGSQILRLSFDLKFIKNNTHNELQGQLTKRNNCAHPSLYRPNLNVSLAFVDEMITQTLVYL